MEDIKIQDVKTALIQKTADWLNQQIECVWNALDINNLKDSDRKLKVEHRGKYTCYYFICQEKFCAEARYYFNREECKWMFELTEVIPEYFSKIHDYFTKGKN